MKTRYVLRSIHSDPASPVYLMGNLLALGHDLKAARQFTSQKAAERFLARNPEYVNLRVERIL